MFASNAKSNAQNRALQKSSGMKLFQKFGTAAPVNTGKKRLQLKMENALRANFDRNKKAISIIVIVFALLIPIVYYTMQWINSLPL